MMKYLLLGDDHKTLFIEDDEQLFSVYFNKERGEWLPGGTRLFDARVGFDPYEPEDSPYRYGSSSYLLDIVEISKQEAERFIGRKISEEYITTILKRK